MSKNFLCALVILCVGAVTGAAQDDKRDVERLLAPFLSETTFALIEIDVKNIDIDALFEHARKSRVAPAAEEFAGALRMAREHQARFQRSGGRYVYVIFSLSHRLAAGPPPPLLVIPAAQAESREALTALLQGIPNLKLESRDGVLLAGPAAVFETLPRRPGRPDPELGQALAAASQPQRGAFVLPEALRRALEELAPELPAAVGGGSIKTLTRGLQWVSLGLDLSAKFEASVVVKAENAESAQKLDDLAHKAITLSLKEGNLPAQIGELLRFKQKDNRLELTLDARTFDNTLLAMAGRVRETGARAQSANNLKQIALAMHNYHDVHKSFPAHASYDKQKKPLLSWRVHILPYLEESDLYQQFKLNEPWDSAHNKALLTRMPKMYQSPLSADKRERDKTTYVVPFGPKMLFNGPKAPQIRSIIDGTSNTIMVVDADDQHAVYWTQPEDLRVDPKQPRAGAVREMIGIIAAFCDGSVRVIQPRIADERFLALLTPAGGEVPTPD
jgi:hypothetical protein